MVAAIVITVLAVLHILFAVGWLGAVIFFVSVIGPTLPKFSPPASLEFLAKVGPPQLRFFGVVATGTIVFGLALLFAAFGTDYTFWPTSIVIGFSLGFLAYLIAVLVTIPAFRKVDKLAHEMMTNPPTGPPPAEFVKTLNRGRLASALVGLILLLTFLFMVATAFPF